MRQREPAHYQQVLFSQKIKQFLSNFKVNPCANLNHPPQLCNDWHGIEDRRRNPYKEQGFRYWPSDMCSCQQYECTRCHNMYEICFHPLKYKTARCYNYNCPYGFFCSYLHQQEAESLQKYQFFRFQLATFKTQLCPIREGPGHELASCHFYHNESDRRRNTLIISYSHVQCGRTHCEDETCAFAHNKIQQLYHPSRYKTKYCQSFIHKKSCQYNEYCSFAHSNKQIKIQLLHQMPKTPEFYNFKYKTVWCPYTNQHDRGNCPYAHNFQDYRRDPMKNKYTPEVCLHWSKGQIKSIQDSGCPYQMDCSKSHGWLERKYHPDLKKWQSGQNDNTEKEEKNLEKVQKKVNSKVTLSPIKEVLGAPFFKRQERGQRCQSEAPRGKKEEKQKKQKWFNFSFFLPESETFSNQNNENGYGKNDLEAIWKSQQSNASSPKYYFKVSSLTKLKITKKNRSYTKSLKQILTSTGLDQKLASIRMSQVKLLSLKKEDVEKMKLDVHEKRQLIDAIAEYSKTHSLSAVKYTDSMVKFFKGKFQLQTLDKLRKKGITQKILEKLSSSTIEDLSFLEEEQKSTLPKILQKYADDRAFRQLNTLIEKQTGNTTKFGDSKPRSDWTCFNT